MSIESVMPSNHLMLCHPFLCLPSIFPSIRVFSNESTLLFMWPKYWSFSFSIRPSSEHPGLISFRMDWLDLLAVRGTLKSLLQHHSSKASILQHSAFFIVQFSHQYMTTGKRLHAEDLATGRHKTTGGLTAWKPERHSTCGGRLGGQKENPKAKNSGLSRNREQPQLTVSTDRQRRLSRGMWN